MENEVIDNYKEHSLHQSFHADCSDCFVEKKATLATREQMWNKLYPDNSRNQHAISRLDYGEHNRNPIRD